MIKGSLSIEEQRKVTKLRQRKSHRVVVVDAGVGVDISNVATNFRVYETNLGLSNKEKQETIVKSNGGTISFGDALAGGLEVESQWNHGLTIILVSSMSSRVMGLTYDYAVNMSGSGSYLLADYWVLWVR